MRKLKHLLLQQLIVALAFTFSVTAVGADAVNRGFFWEVKGGEKPLYLLGSIHFAAANFYPFADHVEAAFTEADQLVVEVDISNIDPIALQAQVFEMGTYTPPESLADHVSPATLAKLKKYLHSNNLPVDNFLRQKPGLIVMTITSLELAKQGLNPNQGVDLYFLQKAFNQKAIKQLESFQEQFAVLLADEYGESMLSQTLDETASYDQLVYDLVTIWRHGDIERLHELLITEPLTRYPESRAAFDALFTDRNIKMLEKITGYLSEPTSHFVVIGAGHMIGKDGIVEGLRAQGFEVIRR